MASFYDRVKVGVGAAPGTGSVSLGAAVAGYRGFDAAGVTDGAEVSYVIEDGASWELGHGTYTKSGAVLARTKVIGSSAGGSAITASATATVYLTLLALDVASLVTVPSGLVSARYWRIDTLTPPNGGPYVGTGELQFFDASGTKITGTAPFADTPHTGESEDVIRVNDGDLNTYWTTNPSNAQRYVGLDLGAGATPCSVLISSRNGYPGGDIASFTVSYSNDMAAWTSLKSFASIVWTGNDNQTQTFTFQSQGGIAAPTQLPKSTVAGLPAGTAGQAAFASDGRKSTEAAGAGTGVMVVYSGGAWRRVSDDSVVVA